MKVQATAHGSWASRVAAYILPLGVALGAASPCLGADATTSRDATATMTVAGLSATAPEFVGVTGWLNSAPLSMAALRGKVVLVDFWTYGCINCVRTLPYVTQLYARYKDKGLVVVGVHTPEFPFETSTSNVRAALQRHGITYPVAQDNDSATWNAYGNQYWPAQYVIDRRGRIVFTHAGEGAYDAIEGTIRSLLNDES
jgi:thiol-disulfide isomerase/thioredoxin